MCEVVECGAEVKGVKPGDRVVSAFAIGGYAEYARAFGRYVAKVPAKVDPFEAAPLACAGVTTYKAVKMSGARPSDLVAIFGIGGLGHLALQYAKIAGASLRASRCRAVKYGRKVSTHSQRASAGQWRQVHRALL